MSDIEQLPTRFAAAIERLDGDVGLLGEMAAITFEDIPDVKAHAEVAIASGDCTEAASGLHKLKGMLSTFETEGVTLEIQEMLDLARKGRAKEVQRGYARHRKAVEELISQIKSLAKKSNG